MRWCSWLTHGLRTTLRANGNNQDIADELAFHMASRIDDLVARGASRAQAERQARLEFGSRDKTAAEYRDAARFTFVEDFLRDCRYGLRSLGRHPGLIAISILSLALGIGVNMLLFSGISAVFFARPTVARPEQLVWVQPAGSGQLAFRNIAALEATNGFASLSAYRQVVLGASVDGGVTSVSGFAVTPGFFDTLGVSPLRGRAFDRRSRSDAIHETAISHAFWRRAFDLDPSALGRTITLNGRQYTITGILAEDYVPVVRFLDPDVYVPASGTVLPGFDGLDDTNALDLIARVHAKQGVERASIALRAFDADRPRRLGLPAGWPGRIEAVGPIRMSEAPLAAKALRPFLAMLCGLVLLIAAANVAGLLLARAAGQQQELALLSALGAPRRRIMQRMFAESLLLAIAGAAGGLVVTWAVLPMLQHVTVPLLGELHFRLGIDWTLGAYAAILTLATGLACGLFPALSATRRAPKSLLAHHGVHGGGARRRLRQTMVVAAAAATVILLVAALLFTRSLLRLSSVDTGLDLDNGLVSSIDVPAGLSREPRIITAAVQTIKRLEAQPGVERVSIAEIIPLSMDRSSARFAREGETDAGGRTVINSVGPGYFATMGIAQLDGRDFRDADRAGSPPVVIVNRAFATTYFPDRPVIGRRIRGVRTDPFSEIVGIVENSSMDIAGEPPSPQVFYPWLQRPVSSQQRPLNIIVRTAVAPTSMLRPIHAITSRLEANAPTKTVTLRDATSFEFIVRRAGARLLGGLGLLGLVLAAVGLYGIISYVVASRTTEFGVRMALGATSATIERDVVWRGLRLTLQGLGIGGLLALAGARVLASTLAGLSPADPITFLASAALLIAMGIAASYWPARQATRIDPMAALRRP